MRKERQLLVVAIMPLTRSPRHPVDALAAIQDLGRQIGACDVIILGHRSPGLGIGIELVAYVAFKGLSLLGERFYEAKYAYTVPELKRRGLHRQLLWAALREHPLISDRFGMRDEAFNAWRSIEGVQRHWYDEQNNEFIDDNIVPISERFCFGDPCQRWHLVLRKPIAAAISEAPPG